MQSFPLALILTSVPFMTSMGITPGPNNILGLLRRLLHTEKRRRWFNYSMAGLLAISILPVLWE